jgi:glycosyltransferase involved in cell wall biosynthesis
MVSEPDNGIYDGMNKGLGLATGDVIGLLNADDIYAGPDILSKAARVFSEKNMESCYGDLVYVREKRRPKVKVGGYRRSEGGGRERQKSDASGGMNSFGVWMDGDLVYVDANDTDRVVRYWRSWDYKPKKFYMPEVRDLRALEAESKTFYF